VKEEPASTVIPEVPPEEAEAYRLHVRLAPDMQGKLWDAATLNYRLRNVEQRFPYRFEEPVFHLGDGDYWEALALPYRLQVG